MQLSKSDVYENKIITLEASLFENMPSLHCVFSLCEGQIELKLNSEFLLTVSEEPEALCLNEQVERSDNWSSGREEVSDLDEGRKKDLRSWECSRPCRRGICIHPSRPQRPAGRCV